MTTTTVAYPFAPGDRVRHIVSTDHVGTVRSIQPHLHGDPAIHVDVVVLWDSTVPGPLGGRASRHGLASLEAIA